MLLDVRDYWRENKFLYAIERHCLAVVFSKKRYWGANFCKGTGKKDSENACETRFSE